MTELAYARGEENPALLTPGQWVQFRAVSR